MPSVVTSNFRKVAVAWLVVAALFTVTTIDDEVVEVPSEDVAVAESWCGPFVVAVVSQAYAYGELKSIGPKLLPSSLN